MAKMKKFGSPSPSLQFHCQLIRCQINVLPGFHEPLKHLVSLPTTCTTRHERDGKRLVATGIPALELEDLCGVTPVTSRVAATLLSIREEPRGGNVELWY